jgi:hypothetical protein
MVITKFEDHIIPFGAGPWNAPSSSTTPGFGLFFANNANVYVFSKAVYGSALSGVVLGQPFTVKYGFDGTNVFCDINAVRKVTQTATGQSGSITHPLQIAQQAGITHAGNYAIQKAKLTVNNAVVFDSDFNGSTSIRHGDTKFQAAVGGPVTINQAGNDPATVIKKPVLRFDGVNDGLQGLFANNINSGYMFAAFSVLGDGGESFGRVFTTNLSTSGNDYDVAGASFSLRNSSTTNLLTMVSGMTINSQSDMFDDANGDILHAVKIENESQTSEVNNASFLTDNKTTAINSDKFNIGFSNFLLSSAAIDLEFLALFPASITDAQADSVRNYINNRNNVFDLKDGFGYYFYDATKAPVGAISSGSSAWNGRIVGSDNGDADKLATQATANDQPVSDGYVVTFADNSDHLDIPSTSQAGWQICGTSLGTFVYRINGTTAVTELNLLGNLGNASYRQAGDLYGIILLPESATGADIESARRLLIDRGAADSSGNVDDFWRTRSDIVEFNFIDTSNVTSFYGAWRECSSLLSFPSINASSGVYFNNAWRSTSSLTSFPAGAKLGTSASSVNFAAAWQSSGLTSFNTPLPTATNCSYSWNSCTSLSSFGEIDISSCSDFTSAFQYCSALTSFPAGAKLGTEATNVNFDSAWRSSGLTSFPADIDLSKGTNFESAWRTSNSLVTFEEISFEKGEKFYATWYFDSNLENFGAGCFDNWNPDSIDAAVFDYAWDGCSALTAQSVENILTSIDASGQYATSTGASGGSALGDAGIDIDYNAASGSLSAATNSAVTSLKAKGWSIIVNNVTL